MWSGKNGRVNLAVFIDCCTRKILGSRDYRTTAEAALEEALVHRFGAIGRRSHQPLALRSDKRLVFSSRHYMATVKAFGLTQEFRTPYTPEQNGLGERFFRSLKDEGIWQHRCTLLGQA
ncbi:MAG: transposase family protein [Halomonas sp.]|nr:transposase family protein [Halomonas sp.]